VSRTRDTTSERLIGTPQSLHNEEAAITVRAGARGARPPVTVSATVPLVSARRRRRCLG